VKDTPARGSVKGSVLTSRIAFVRDERGAAAVERVLAQLTDEHRAVLPRNPQGLLKSAKGDEICEYECSWG
jgi:hypothetical protein